MLKTELSIVEMNNPTIGMAVYSTLLLYEIFDLNGIKFSNRVVQLLTIVSDNGTFCIYCTLFSLYVSICNGMTNINLKLILTDIKYIYCIFSYECKSVASKI